MKIKTTELTGKALDWSVGVAVGYDVDVFTTRLQTRLIGQLCSTHWNPTTSWGQLGPLLIGTNFILEEILGATECSKYRCVVDYLIKDVLRPQFRVSSTGDTPQIAACRAIVAARLGDEVDVPEVMV